MRRDLALKLGADEVIDPVDRDPVKEVLRLTGGHGADLGPGGVRDDEARSTVFDAVDGSTGSCS